MEIQAHSFTVDRIQLKASPFHQAMQKDTEYLLSLEPDRFLHNFRINAKLKPKGEIYGGWENSQVAGHCLGHHLSAISRMTYAANDPKFRSRIDYIVDELAECQSKIGTGYVAGLPDADEMWKQVRSGNIKTEGHALNGYWVPWYTLHKLFAGLIDCHNLVGNKKALEIAKGLADWTIWETEKLTHDQWQNMLQCEHGGMNESLAHLYTLTGNHAYLDLSEKFYHEAVLDPLSKGIDDLPGLHSNTQIPKVIGCAVLYEITGNPKYHTIATTFWNKMVHHHTYCIGGNSVYEHLGPPDKLNDTLNPTDCETCNTYNMIKLTRHLFSWNPTAEYGDYAERALINHILASQNHKDSMMCYYVTLAPVTSKVFSTPFDSFWCCTGTGMENHSRYGESIYFQNDNALYVDQFIPSQLDWKEQRTKIRIESQFPYSSSVAIYIHPDVAKPINLMIRKAYWLANMASLTINGKPITPDISKNGFWTINRTFHPNDKLEITMPMDLHLWPMPDNPKRAAIFYGPVTLAGDLSLPGTEIDPQPAILDTHESLHNWIEARNDKPLHFTTNHVGRPADISLIPFFEINDQKQSVYWDFITEEEWKNREKSYSKAKAEEKQLNARTIDHFIPGDNSNESSHHLLSKNSGTGIFMGRNWRHALDGGFIEFTMKVIPSTANDLALTFWGSDSGGREFDVLADGHLLGTITLNNNLPGEFYRQFYKIPGQIIEGNSTVVIRLQAKPGMIAGGLFGARTLRLSSMVEQS